MHVKPRTGKKSSTELEIHSATWHFYYAPDNTHRHFFFVRSHLGPPQPIHQTAYCSIITSLCTIPDKLVTTFVKLIATMLFTIGLECSFFNYLLDNMLTFDAHLLNTPLPPQRHSIFCRSHCMPRRPARSKHTLSLSPHLVGRS